MRTLISLLIIAPMLFVSNATSAQDVFDNLANEPVTMLDAGIKRIRSAALETTRRLTPTLAARPQTSVLFDKETRNIRVQFTVQPKEPILTEAACRQLRATFIKEMFLIGSTSYVVPLSDEQKVMRRLGAMFTREPHDKANTPQAMGERLAESTIVQLSMRQPGEEKPVICAGKINAFLGTK